MTYFLDWPRGYVPRGRVAHLLSHSEASLNSAEPALCGVAPWWGGWFGSGTYDEAELLATLPVCQRCARIFEKRR